MHPHADPLNPHSHDPNPAPPSPDPDFMLSLPDGKRGLIKVENLYRLPAVTLTDCYIVSTGHGTTGPFTFAGPTLLSLIQSCTTDTDWNVVEIVSGDGFGTRVTSKELHEPSPSGPIILAYAIDGLPLERDQGLIRLIVPSERDDALRQVKWVKRIHIAPKASIGLWKRYFVTQNRLRRYSIILLATAIFLSLTTMLLTFFFR